MPKTLHILLIDEEERPRPNRSVDAVPGEFQITRKVTLSEGLEAMQRLRFDAILLSLSLPDTSRTDSVRQTLKAANGVPVIALLNEGDAAGAGEAMRLGLHDCVFKRCHCDSLVRIIRYGEERKQLVAEREHLQQQVTKNDTHFIAHLSHEWRNSLACIHQFGNILIDGLAGDLSHEQREYLGIMLENSTKIRSTLDKIPGANSGSA